MTKKQLLAYLQTKPLVVMSTCNLKGFPQSAVMCLTTGDDFNFYLFTEKNTRKINNIEDNKRVALVIGGLQEDPSAQINGFAQILSDTSTKKAKDIITKVHPEWNDYFSPNTVFLKITPKRIQYSDFHQNVFKEFIF